MKPQSLRVIVLLGVLIAAWTAVARPAQGAPIDDKRAEAARVQAQIDANGERISALSEQYDGARLKFNEATKASAEAQRRMDIARRRTNQLRQQLASRASDLYTNSSAGGLDMLNVDNVSDLSSRGEYSSGLSNRDRVLAQRFRSARDELASGKAEFNKAKTAAKDELANIDASKGSVETANAKQEQLLSQAKGELATLMKQEQDRRDQEAATQARARLAQVGAKNIAPKSAFPTPQGGRNDGLRQGPPTPQGGRNDGLRQGLPAPPAASGGATAAVAYAFAQVGKPYVYAAAGPDAFDCSGLTMMAWRQGGVSMPHFSGSQYAMFPHVPLSELQSGDLVFSSNPNEHVGLYVGAGMMVAATHTGDFVRYQALYSNITLAARPG